jgi:hypothetical protein
LWPSWAAAISAAALPGARTEEAQRQFAQGGLAASPLGGRLQPARQQRDVEAVLARAQVHLLLLGREQVEQQGGDPAFLQPARHLPVARAVPSAAAAVREQHQALRLLRQADVAMQPLAAMGDADFLEGRGGGCLVHRSSSWKLERSVAPGCRRDAPMV